MKLRNLYRLAAFTDKMKLAKYYEKENKIPMWEGEDAKWYEETFPYIYRHSDKIFMETEGLTREDTESNEEMLNQQIDDGYWLYCHDCFDGMQFTWFEDLAEAVKYYKKVKIHSLFNTEGDLLYKYLFFCSSDRFKLIKYQEESSFSKRLFPLYAKYIRDMIMIPLRNLMRR